MTPPQFSVCFPQSHSFTIFRLFPTEAFLHTAQMMSLSRHSFTLSSPHYLLFPFLPTEAFLHTAQMMSQITLPSLPFLPTEAFLHTAQMMSLSLPSLPFLPTEAFLHTAQMMSQITPMEVEILYSLTELISQNGG